MEFGDAIPVDRALVEQYKAGKEQKRKACAQLLDVIYHALHAVTVTAPNYERLSAIQMVRRLYNPPGTHSVRLAVPTLSLQIVEAVGVLHGTGRKLTSHEKLELQRRFAAAYEKLQDEPECVSLSAVPPGRGCGD